MSDPHRMTKRELKRAYIKQNTPWSDRIMDQVRMFLLKAALFGLVLLVIYLNARSS